MSDGTRKVSDRQIVESIRRLTASMGYPPTVREIGEAVGLASPGSVKRRLAILRDMGAIEFEDRKPRTVRVVR
jgi:repressor LexA